MEVCTAKRHKLQRGTAQAQHFPAGQRLGFQQGILTQVAEFLGGTGQQREGVLLGVVGDGGLAGTQGRVSA